MRRPLLWTARICCLLLTGPLGGCDQEPTESPVQANGPIAQPVAKAGKKGVAPTKKLMRGPD